MICTNPATQIMCAAGGICIHIYMGVAVLAHIHALDGWVRSGRHGSWARKFREGIKNMGSRISTRSTVSSYCTTRSPSVHCVDDSKRVLSLNYTKRPPSQYSSSSTGLQERGRKKERTKHAGKTYPRATLHRQGKPIQIIQGA